MSYFYERGERRTMAENHNRSDDSKKEEGNIRETENLSELFESDANVTIADCKT